LFVKRKIKIITFTILSLMFVAASCDKQKNYPKDSIVGSWFSMEQSSVYGYRQYNVNIDYNGYDSTHIIIYNFHNLGYELETYASIQDTILTLEMTSSFENISGTGHIERDFSAIYWEYTYSGQIFESLFRRP